jgi:hypothetical protein
LSNNKPVPEEEFVKIIAISLASLLIAGTASAQECVDLARVMARETSKVATQDQVQAYAQSSLCTEQYDKASSEQQAQIEGGYSLFHASAGGSQQQIKEEQSKRCGGQYGSFWSSKVASTEIDKVSAAGADAVRACLSARSFRTIELTITGEAVDPSFRYSGQGDTIINGVSINPPSIAKCTARFNGREQDDLTRLAGQRLKSGDTLTLNCTRQPEPVAASTPADGSRRVFKAGNISVATNADPATIPLIGYTEPPLAESAADHLGKQIADLQKQFAALKTTSDQQSERSDKAIAALVGKNAFQNRTCNRLVVTEVDSAGENASLTCPAGQYVAGVLRYKFEQQTNGIVCCPAS